MLKRIIKSERFRALLCWLGANYIRLVWATSRWTVEGEDIPRGYWERGEPFIFAFWHGHIMMLPKCWDLRRPMNMLISQHRDGRIIARIIGHFGLGTVAGSSSRGGAAAMRILLKALKSGEYIGITPDGPRGPRMRASDGIVSIARLAGVPIIPCATSFTSRKLLGTWDRFQVALPFTKGVFLWGAPIRVDKDLDDKGIEAKRLEIEAAMITLAQNAERRMGHTPTDPASPAESDNDGEDGPSPTRPEATP